MHSLVGALSLWLGVLLSLWIGLPPCGADAAISTGNGTRTIYIIRHGEKKWSLGCLNATGHARAVNLINVFNDSRFTTPSHIFANRYDDPVR